MQQSSELALKNDFFQFLRKASQNMLKIYVKTDFVELAKPETDVPIFGHWMAMVLVSGSPFKITFKVHYKTESIAPLASSAYQKETKLMTHSQVDDFMKEYCNLVAGRIKKACLSNGLDMGMSLPISTRGFDEVFATPNSHDKIHMDYWNLQVNGHTFTCSAELNFTNLSQFPKDLKLTLEESDQGLGEVEYL